MMNRLEVSEMWRYCRILQILWTQHEINENVLRRLHENRELLTIIKRQKMEYFGHMLPDPKYELLYRIM